MAHVGSILLFVALRAATAAVHKFESYADSQCFVLTKTDYLKLATGSTDCYVYTDETGVVATDENGVASSFTLTCNGAPTSYAQYESENCMSSSVSGTEPWFTKTMCTSERFHQAGQEMTIYSNYGHPDSSCSKAYLNHW